MRCVPSPAPALAPSHGPGRVILASLLLAATPPAPAPGVEFPEVAQLPERAEMPDPLVMLDGEPVTSPEQWVGRRRPELKALFQHYMYGEMPPRPPGQAIAIEREDRDFLGGKATLKEVTIAPGASRGPEIHLLLVVPNERRGPAPAFLGIELPGQSRGGRRPEGRAAGILGARVLPGRQGQPGDRRRPGRQVDVLGGRGRDRPGLRPGDVLLRRRRPRPQGATPGMGVFPHYRRPGRSRPGPARLGGDRRLGLGAFAGRRYLETDPDIDAGSDRRRRVVAAGQGGDRGRGLRRADRDGDPATRPAAAGRPRAGPTVGESVRQINNGNPHWFAAAFQEFNEQPERLPFDQNCLVALVAPRPVLLTNAVRDVGANPEGQFQVLRSADPVYRMLGAGGLDARSHARRSTRSSMARSASTSARARTRWAARTGPSSSNTPTVASAGRGGPRDRAGGALIRPDPIRSDRRASCKMRIDSGPLRGARMAGAAAVILLRAFQETSRLASSTAPLWSVSISPASICSSREEGQSQVNSLHEHSSGKASYADRRNPSKTMKALVEMKPPTYFQPALISSRCVPEIGQISPFSEIRMK